MGVAKSLKHHSGGAAGPGGLKVLETIVIVSPTFVTPSGSGATGSSSPGWSILYFCSSSLLTSPGFS
jgi:hypothetical protein